MIQRIARALRADLDSPARAVALQDLALRRILGECAASEAGRALGLASVRDRRDLLDRPSTDAGPYQEYAARVAELGADAGAGIVGRSRPVSIALTSGTTGAAKRFVITRAGLAGYRRFSLRMNAWVASWTRASSARRAPARARMLLLTARPVVSVSAGGLTEGFISGFMASSVPWPLSRRILPSPPILRLPSWESKIPPLLAEARHAAVVGIAGVPPVVAHVLAQARALYGVSDLRQVWPHFRAVLSSGVPVTADFRAELAAAFGGHAPAIWELYAATEAQFAHSVDPESGPELAPHPHELAYVFEDARGNRHLWEDLREGERYAPLFSSVGGLVNYRIGDWIEVARVRPGLRIRVSGRDAEEISLATEKISVAQVNLALADAARAIGPGVAEGVGRASHWAIWPTAAKPARLRLALFSDDEVLAPRVLGELSDRFDRALQDLNPSYREMRMGDWVYAAPIAERRSVADFEEYRRRNLDRGQFKPKRLLKSEALARAEFVLDPTPATPGG